MGSIKVERVQRRVMQIMGHLVEKMSDPRLEKITVTVTRVELSGDIRHAKIFVATPDEEGANVLTLMRALEHAKGFLQSEVASRLDTRTTPLLEFFYDEGIQKQFHIEGILSDLAGERGETPADPIPEYEVFEEDELDDEDKDED